MYSDWGWSAVGGFLALFIWLGSLTYLVWRENQFLKSLFPKSGERDIRQKFAEVIKTVEGFKGELSILADQVSNIKQEGAKHIQRIELLRFNPYDDTGGDISFTVCLLDKDGSGVVITSLHARSATRVFAKNVILGKGKSELSKEEELVIKKAMGQ